MVWPISTKSGIVTQSHPVEASEGYKLQILKIQDGAAAILKNRKK